MFQHRISDHTMSLPHYTKQTAGFLNRLDHFAHKWTHCFPLQLDASADGYVRAEAAAMMALAHPSCVEGPNAAPVMGVLASSAVNQVREVLHVKIEQGMAIEG